MRKATPVTSPINNQPNTIVIDGYGTCSFIGFAQIIYNAGIITYETYLKCRKIVLSEKVCGEIVNMHPELFPIEF